MVNAYLRRTDSGWRALYLWIMVSAGNRAGKTMCLAIIIFHSCVYRMGLQPPDMSDPAAIERWGKLPYHWYHFAVEQGPSEMTFGEIAMMLGGIHPAQANGCPWADQVGGAAKIAILTDTGIGSWCTGSKERGEYAWVKFAPEFGGAEVHFRSTKAKALSTIGANMHGVSFDEAGLVTDLTWLIEEVLHARRLGTGGQFILISTPSASTSTDFQDLWLTGDPEDPFRMDRRIGLRISTRDNIDFGIDRESFDALVDGMPQEWIDQNIDGKFIQALMSWFHGPSVDAAFRAALPPEQGPREGEVYIEVLDPGLKDKTWCLVFRVRPDGVAVGVTIQRQSGKQTTRGITRLGKRIYHVYWMKGKAQIECGVDTTALGGHMFRDLLEEDDDQFPGIPVRSVEFGGVAQTKRKLLSDARSAIDEGKIIFPTEGEWAEVRKQLRNYKLLDRKIEQDLVMCVAIAVKLLRSAPDQSGRPAARFEYNNVAVPEKVDDGINAQSFRARMAQKSRQRRA
jgi:hypothetical protein